MSRLRLVPIAFFALALRLSALGAQQAPVIKTLATFPDSVWYWAVSPNGRFVVGGTPTELRVYEAAGGRSWRLAEVEAWDIRWSPRGDRIAYVRAGDGDTGEYVWTMPVDQETGMATGPAQRVTVGQGEEPSFSLDGRFLAYAAYDSGKASLLRVLPVNGGPERTVGRSSTGFGPTYWSADGKNIYSQRGGPTGFEVLKYPVAGGAPVVVHLGGGSLVGMTADRRYLILAPNQSHRGDQVTVIDTAGRYVGHVPVPVEDLLAYGGVLGDSAFVRVFFAHQTFIEVRPVAGGEARRLPLVGESDDVPIWSPDGRRIAFQVHQDGRTSLAVMNADGTDVRVYRETAVLVSAWSVKWSPNSRLVAFVSPDAHRLSLLDVTAGTARPILDDSTRYIGGIWRWRSDGRAILFRSRSRRDSTSSIDEVALSGERRRLRSWTGEPNWQFVGDSALFVRTDSAALLFPIHSGPPRRLTDVPPKSATPWLAASDDGQLVGGPWTPGGLAHQIEWFSVTRRTRSVIDLPFTALLGNSPPQFTPDDSGMLLFGRTHQPTGETLYLVPLDGTQPRALADLGNVRPNAILAASVSPDGRWVAYSVQPKTYSQVIQLIDLRGAIPRTPSRGPGR